jgi:hypothetical protein
MSSKTSIKKLSNEIDRILNQKIVGGRKSKKSKKSRKSKKSKKKISRIHISDDSNNINEYVKDLINQRRSKRPSRKRLPEKLQLFSKLREAVSSVINKKGPVAMKVAKAVKDDLAKTMTTAEIDKDYSAFIQKAIKHLNANPDKYKKLASSL